MEIGSLKSIREHPGLTPPLPVRDKSHLTERFTPSSDKDNSWREESQQLNQLAQMARLRGYR